MGSEAVALGPKIAPPTGSPDSAVTAGASKPTAPKTRLAANKAALALDYFAGVHCARETQTHAAACTAAPGVISGMTAAMVLPQPAAVATPPGPAAPVAKKPAAKPDAAPTSGMQSPMPAPASPVTAGADAATDKPTLVAAAGAAPVTSEALIAGTSRQAERMLETGLTVGPTLVKDDKTEGPKQLADILYRTRFGSKDVLASIKSYMQAHHIQGSPEDIAKQYALAYATASFKAAGGGQTGADAAIVGDQRMVPVINEAGIQVLGGAMAKDARAKGTTVAGMDPELFDGVNNAVMRRMNLQAHPGMTGRELQHVEQAAASKLTRANIHGVGSSSQFSPPAKRAGLAPGQADYAAQDLSTDSLSVASMPLSTQSVAEARAQRAADELRLSFLRPTTGVPSAEVVALETMKASANRWAMDANQATRARASLDSERATFPGIGAGQLSGIGFSRRSRVV